MYIILFLSFITISSFLDFLSEFGYDFKLLKSIIGLSALISFINLFYFIANRKIPKAVKFDVYENTKVVSHGLDVQFEAGIKEAKAPKIVS